MILIYLVTKIPIVHKHKSIEMSGYFYTDESGEVQGPYEWTDIVHWIQEGSIANTTWIKPENETTDWISYLDMVSTEEEQAEEQHNYSTEGGGVHGWEDSVWHYLDDESVVQGPDTTKTIGEWFHMGALGLDRYCSIDGSEWILLEECEPYLTLWAQNVEAEEAATEPAADILLVDRVVAKRRQSVTMMAAQRSHARRSSITSAKVDATPPVSSRRPTNLATKLSSQRSMLRKTNTPSRRQNTKRPQQAPDNALSALMKGMEMRRTIITRGKKRRSSIVVGNRSVFKMADGTVAPESVVRSTRTHRRRVSDFSEDEDSDGWLSD